MSYVGKLLPNTISCAIRKFQKIICHLLTSIQHTAEIVEEKLIPRKQCQKTKLTNLILLVPIRQKNWKYCWAYFKSASNLFLIDIMSNLRHRTGYCRGLKIVYSHHFFPSSGFIIHCKNQWTRKSVRSSHFTKSHPFAGHFVFSGL